MTDETKMHAYIVALSFPDGLVISHTVAPNAESAAAMVGVQAGRTRQGEPHAIAWMELTPEWLRMALRACETGKVSGEVVSLVSDNLRPAIASEPDPVPRCIEHGAPIPCDACIAKPRLRPGGCQRHPMSVSVDGVCMGCARDGAA